MTSAQLDPTSLSDDLNMRGSLFSAFISTSNSAFLLRRQTARTLGRQQVTKRHLSSYSARNNAAIMGSSEGSNAWVGVKGAGSLDLRSETHCFDLFTDILGRRKKKNEE